MCGAQVVLRFALGMFSMHQSELLRINDRQEMYEFLRSMPRSCYAVAELFKCAFNGLDGFTGFTSKVLLTPIPPIVPHSSGYLRPSFFSAVPSSSVISISVSPSLSLTHTCGFVVVAVVFIVAAAVAPAQVIRAKRQKHLTDVRREMDEFAAARAQAMTESRKRADLYAPACVSSDDEAVGEDDEPSVVGDAGGVDVGAAGAVSSVGETPVSDQPGYIAIGDEGGGEVSASRGVEASVASLPPSRAVEDADERRVSGPYDDDDVDAECVVFGEREQDETVSESSRVLAEGETWVGPSVSDE
jgi:hypothetical protein